MKRLKRYKSSIVSAVKLGRRLGKRHGTLARAHGAHMWRRLRRGVAFLGHRIRNVYRAVHRHIAHRPHQYMLGHAWYRRWHGWSYHKHVHGVILGVSIIISVVYAVGSFRPALAADLIDSWDFSTPSDYTLDSGLENTGSSVRLKAQNYATDANTAALFHFDEPSGANASDSSGNANDGTVSDATFGAGNLNNALDFDGVTSGVTVPDSPSLSLSQQNTLESWTKFDTAFSAGSASQRQSIIDKGDYQLYYDNETGKVTYELADSSASGWTNVGGNDLGNSWDLNGKRSVNATAKIGSDVYVGIGVDVGDAEVWRWNGTAWTKIGGGPNSVNGSWAAQTFEGVYSLTTDGTNLYAGLGVTAGDAEVWRWNGTAWTKIGGDAANGSWAVNTFEQVWALDYFGDTLYAGLGTTANDAEVWSYNGTSWTKIGGDSLNSGWAANYEIVATLTNDGTNLYAGLGVTAGDAEVWRWNGTAWTKIGGDTLNSSWDATFETVRTLRYFEGVLYAGLGDSANDAEVWSYNGTSWTKIGGDSLNSGWAANYEQIGSFAYGDGDLYAGLGTSDGDAEVWRWNGTAWTKIGGDGLNSSWATAAGDIVNTLTYDGGTVYAGLFDAAGAGWMYTWNGTSWTLMGGNYVNNSWGYYGAAAVQVMQDVGGYLYAGLGNVAGSAMVWQYNGTSWTLVGGQGVNGSWAPNTFEQILSMASYNGKLYVGLGASANDAEVWEWDGAAWSQVGGDSLNSGWTTNYEEVSALASYGGNLYAGLALTANDAEVWSYNGTSWTKIGGDSLNSGWTTNFERVASLAVYNNELYAGLGFTATDAEVWRWNGTSWTKLGGDGVNGSWNTVYEQVETLIPYDGKLYAGLGNSTDDAELWEYDGTSWTLMGGDDVNGSWTAGTYERVKTLAVYNGDLYAGLGAGAGDGEVWRYADGVWTKLGGNGINGGWSSVIEEVEAFSAYKGKFYVGTGLTANADALVWSWGDNGYLQSAASSFDTAWRHVAATYDGTTMRIYIDGVLNSSVTENLSLPDSPRTLLIGRGFGGRESGKPAAAFEGMLDEVRVSNTARSSFTTKPYVATPQIVRPTAAVRQNGVWHWDTFADSETLNGGSITFRLSYDGGTTWRYWDGSGWVLSASTAQANTAAVVNANIALLPVTFSGVLWQAILQGDGTQQVTLGGVALESTSDTTDPTTNASVITASKVNGGASLAQNGWTNGSSPYFSWTAGSDTESGIKGYCAYLGTDNTADPATTKGLLGTSPIATGGHCQFMVGGTELDLATAGYLGTPLSSSTSPYYLTLKAIDNAGNVINTTEQFHFRFDNTSPANPGFITAPSGFVNTKAITMTWPTSGGSTAADTVSGVAGLQYRIGGSGTWYGDSHSGTGDINDLLSNDGSYTTQDPPDFDDLIEGTNTVYFRTWDNAGNVTSTYVTAALKINTAGSPSEPQNVIATPGINTSNAFAFDWDPPATFVGDVDNITYCYTVNTLPSPSSCTFTAAGVTGLGSGPYATQPGANTFYVVARDESNNINYASYATATFTANTPAPGIPLNVDIVDVSIKATNNWRLALTWDAPSFAGAGIASYKVYRSTDNVTFAEVGSSSSTTYIDAGLSQQRYYYKVRACDSTSNCGADSSTVNELPTGKFTSSASLVSGPEISDITTKRARINWSTDRASDSKISIGTASGQYSPSEVGNSTQVTAHEIDLNNLSAGTTYYFVAKWTDEDGNTGTSQEYSFTTAPAPSFKEVQTDAITLSSARVTFTSKNATKVILYYGPSEAFGGVTTINTSSAESNYQAFLTGLTDGTKYFFKLVAYDAEGGTYDTSIFSFTTPARPQIRNLQFQPVEGEPTSTQRVSWSTNVAATSTITYGKVNTSGSDVHDSALVTEHEVIIRDLEDDSEYFLFAQSRDADGNLAVSDRHVFRTALDTRPPRISDVAVESSIRGTGAEARGQVVVSWRTDEPATSQIAYAEGSGATTFNSRTAEDDELSFEHIVIVSDLPTSKVYSIQPVSRDKADNAGTGTVQSAIIGRASDDVLTIILETLKNIFGL